MIKRILWLAAFLAFCSSAQAQIPLKQSTATTVNFKLTTIASGADDTTATVTSITLKMFKHSNTSTTTVTSATCAASGSNNDCVHGAVGLWNAELTAANTDTLGRMDICASYSGDYTDCTRYVVVAAASYAVNVEGSVADSSILTALDTRIPAALNANGNMKADVLDFEGNTAALPAIQTGLLTAPKGVAYSNFQFKMYKTADGTAAPGLTVTCKCQKDAGSGANCTNSGSIAQVTGMSGWYRMSSVTSTEMNGDEIAISCTATTARDVDFKIRTQH